MPLLRLRAWILLGASLCSAWEHLSPPPSHPDSPSCAWQFPARGHLLRRKVLSSSSLGGSVAALGLTYLALRQRGGGGQDSSPSSKGLRMSVVDSAVHVWKEDPRYPWATSTPPAADASAEELLALMDSNGVDRTVLVQPICYLWDNSYVRDCMRRFPDRFAAVARVNPEDDASVLKLEELAKEGFVGVRFGPLDRAWWDTERMRRILAKAGELNFPVLLFLGKDGGKALPWVAPTIREMSGVRFIIDHMADVPPSDEQQIQQLLSLASCPNVLVKISHVWATSSQKYPWPDAVSVVQKVVNAFGADRCLFASDWPVCKMPAWPGGDTSYEMTVARGHGFLHLVSWPLKVAVVSTAAAPGHARILQSLSAALSSLSHASLAVTGVRTAVLAGH